MEEKEYLTQEKYDELVKELDHLKKVQRKEIAEHLEYAKSLGDLSENAEYHEARDLQANTEDRIKKLEGMIKNAVIISNDKRGGLVSVGSTITVQKIGDNKNLVFTLVGSEETDTDAGKVSIKSPFGNGALGKKEGEEFSFTTPVGEFKYKILKLE